ncbi:MAG TPA: division initiation protein [Clostridium sp.]|nr:division initiation protein [Clostridium sp.]
MKKNKATFFIFIATILLGLLISINFNFNAITSHNELNTSEYQNAVEERTRLYKEIGDLKDNNIEITEKINQYIHDDEKNNKILEDMKEQINDYSMFTGSKEVEGPGIILTIDDGTTNVTKEDISDVMSKLLHDSDMALIINELRQAGAEAICVNNHRIVPWSGAVCAWAFIQFDDGSRESAPFKIYAIGDPEKLKAALLGEGSHIRELMVRKLHVNIEESEKISMPASSENGNVSFMKRDEKSN